MKTSKTIQISLRIIFLFSIAMAMSIVPDYAHSFFGDEYCNGIIFNPATNRMEEYFHYGDHHLDWVWHWGYRHWLYFLMGFSLAIVQIVTIIEKIGEDESK